MGSGASQPTDVDGLFTVAKEIFAEKPGNRCAKYLCDEAVQAKVKELSADDLNTFVKCVRTGLENKDSGLGCYAITPNDYENFGFFFNKVIGDYHKDDAAFEGVHESSWELAEAPPNLKDLGLAEELSMRVRVGRNLSKFNLPGGMNQEERIKFEEEMLKSFEAVKAKYGGTVYSLTPKLSGDAENPNLITTEKYDELVKAHVMFKNMDDDLYLKSAGIASDWPYGRGCWQSEEKDKIIWFGEEDQLRIMCMKKGYDISEIFNGLKDLLETITAVEGVEFATSERFGAVTSCPSNLGTGMRASVHIKLPKLTADGTDAKVKEIADPLGLSVRGMGGEHTPIGKDGTVDISPRKRLFIKESEIVQALLDGVKALIEAENACA